MHPTMLSNHLVPIHRILILFTPFDSLRNTFLDRCETRDSKEVAQQPLRSASGLNGRAISRDIRWYIGNSQIIRTQRSKGRDGVLPVRLLAESKDPFRLDIRVQQGDYAKPGNVLDVDVPF